MITRRRLIQTGVVGAALLSLGGGVALLARPPQGAPAPGLRFLTAGDAALLGALAPVMLGLQPGRDGVSVDAIVASVDAAVCGLPPATQDELRRFFDLLARAWARRWLAGVNQPWERAPAAALASFLERWQRSRLLLLRSGYQALHALLGAAWYAQPSSWARIGYAPSAALEALR